MIHEDCRVSGTSYKVFDYLYGRCHLFMSVLNELLGYQMVCLWDEDYWYEDAETPSEVLVHAFVMKPNGEYIDARGLLTRATLESEYEINTPLYKRISKEKYIEAIQQGILFKEEVGEREALRKYIKTNASYYE